MLVFSITLTQKRVRPPVWIILVLHTELAIVRALLVKGLDLHVPQDMKYVPTRSSIGVEWLGVRARGLLLVLYPGGGRTSAGFQTQSTPRQDTRSGQGALARRHTDGSLWAALLKTTVMCEAWRRRMIAPPDPSHELLRQLIGQTQFSFITGSSIPIPIPVPGQYRLSRCLE